MQRNWGGRLLDWVERNGNRLPDPTMHFVIALALVWIASAALAPVDFHLTDPRTGAPLHILNQLSAKAITQTLQTAVATYVSFPPLGVILVASLGIGIAEHSGLVAAALKSLLAIMPRSLLAPMVIGVTILVSVASDAALLVMVPLGGVAFYAAGRHPVAGLLAAYAANMMLVSHLVPSGVDVVMQGFTEKAAQILVPGREVSPLCNWGFTAVAAVLTVLAGWYVIEKVVEPRLAGTAVDGDPAGLPGTDPLSARERSALRYALLAGAAIAALLIFSAWPATSPLRAPDGSLTGMGSPLLRSIVAIVLVLTSIPGVIYGGLTGAYASHKDLVRAMTKTMSSMGYYMVMVFFASQFVRAFAESNLGALIAIKGGLTLKSMALPPLVTLAGLVGLTSLIDLVVASASAKWAMLAPIFVPMLMTAGLSPEVAQLAYRIGDSPSNLLSPLNPYFPLAAAFASRYVRNIGIGTIISLMLPFGVTMMAVYLAELAAFWLLRLPIGVSAPYFHP